MSLKPEQREKADRILEAMHNGKSLRQSCKALVGGPAPSTFCLWVTQDTELSEQYDKAREALIDRLADELFEISDAEPPKNPTTGAFDSAAVAHQRLRVDTRKWALSKLAPKKYGDRVEIAGDADAPLVHRITRTIIDPKKPSD